MPVEMTKPVYELYTKIAMGRAINMSGDYIPIPDGYKNAYSAGYDCFFDSHPITDNPYNDQTPGYIFWRAGWILGFNEVLFPARVYRHGQGTITQNIHIEEPG